MKLNDVITEAEKVRLDPKCWTGKKIGDPKTKMKGGVRVNNCVPAESVAEGSSTTWEISYDYGPHMTKSVTVKARSEQEARDKVEKAAEKKGMSIMINSVEPAVQGVAEGGEKDRQWSNKDMERLRVATKDFDDIMASDGPDQTKHDLIKKRIQTKPMTGPKGQLPEQGVAEGDTTKKLSGATPAPAPNPYLKDILMRHIEEVRRFVQTGYIDPTEPMFQELYEYFANEIPEPVRRSPSRLVRRIGDMIAPYAKFYASASTMNEQGVAEGVSDLGYDAQSLIMKLRRDVEEKRLQPTRQAVLSAARELAGDMDFAPELLVRQVLGQGVAEGSDPEYDDEAGMADNNLDTLRRAVDGLDNLINTGDNLPEWCQEKIAVAKSMLVAVWDYMESEDDEEEDPEVAEMYEAMESLVEEIAARDNVDVDLVWESFESLDDHMLYETAAWRRKEGKSKSGGLNAKGVASYRRENPGSKLQTAVTTKPSKLKKGSKAAKRRKSFCARMGGVKGPMKKPNGKPTRKALALRKWNC